MINSRFNFIVGIAVLLFLGALLTSCEKKIPTDGLQQVKVETQNADYSGKMKERVYIDLTQDPLSYKIDDFADFVGLRVDNSEDIIAIEIGTSFRWVTLEEDIYGVVGFEDDNGILYEEEGWVEAGTQALAHYTIDTGALTVSGFRTILGDFNFHEIEQAN